MSTLQSDTGQWNKNTQFSVRELENNYLLDSSVDRQGPGSKMCGIDGFLVSESNYVLWDVCFCSMALFNS